MRPILILVSLFIVFTISSRAQAINRKRLDSLFQVLENWQLANGSVAIMVNGRVIYQKAIGFAKLDGDKKIAPDTTTLYRIGSISKMFTATMVFQLLEEKKLGLEDKLSSWFPQLPNASKITIKEMLYHRSGLHDYTHDTNFPDWMDQPKTHEEMLAIIAGKQADFEPGTRANYCNSNYLLLGYIIEKITRLPYADAVNTRIVSKIGLKHTFYGTQPSRQITEALSYQYADSAWKLQKTTNPTIHGGAGSLVSTPSDLTVFIQQLFTYKLIKKSSLDSMKTMIDGYGMGMFPFDFGNIQAYGHGGRVEEFYSRICYFPDSKLAISYITNGILYPRNDIIDGIQKICFNQPYTIPFSKPVNLPGIQLSAYTGIYSSGSLPFKVSCEQKDGKLVFNAAGKTMEALPVSSNYFMNLQTGTFFEFDQANGILQVKETDNKYDLHKEK